MKKRKKHFKYYNQIYTLIILLFIIIYVPQPVESKEIIVYGYLGYWSDPGGGWTLNSIDWDALTHVVDAFGIPQSDGTIDSAGLRKTTLTAKAHEKKTRCHVSLGGWGGSWGFKSAVQPGTVDKFITNIYNLVVANNYDGVDIDWEFPDRYFSSAGLPAESDLFNLFMEKLYNKFKDPASAKTFDNKPLEVTFCFSPYYVNEVNWSSIGQYCDYAFMMGYDYSNPWNGPLRNNSWSYNTAGQYRESSVHGACEYIVSVGFPQDKIILGCPFYSTSPTTGFRPSYSFIRQALINDWADYLGFYTSPGPYPGPAEARVEYASNIYYVNDTNSFIHKITYATNQHQPGIGIWEISQCYPYPDLWNIIKRYIIRPVTVEEISIIPSIITNEWNNNVTFLLKVSSFPGSISNITINLSAIAGMTNCLMTNISGNFFRHTCLVTNFTPKGIKNFPIKIINTIQFITNIQISAEVQSISVITQAMAVPDTITNNKIKNIIFTAKAKSRWAEIDEVSINLSPIGGNTSMIMTNISGMTDFMCEYSNAFGITAGDKQLIITAVDKKSNSGTAVIPFKVIDKYPPEPPDKVKALTDRNHIILSWSKGSDETGILGYKIYRGRKKNDCSVISPLIKDTNWIDTSAEIGHEYYYAVKTIDTSQNESKYSKYVSARPFVLKDGEVILEDNYFTGDDDIDTSFNFNLKNAGQVIIKLYSLDGMLIDTIFDEWITAGDKQIYWYMPPEQRSLLGSSVYLIYIITPDFKKTVKVMIFKK